MIRALHYHDATKHHFNQFARSPGQLDWATQPDPFRRYAGVPLVELPRRAGSGTQGSYGQLCSRSPAASPVTLESIGEFFRCSMGLSAWKSYRGTRWALRVNPSSGNLHPTEAYAVWQDSVFHYAADVHALEHRATLGAGAGDGGPAGPEFLVGLSSIHWREAWKYGERAFRYCQHDMGHALGALRIAAALLGWQMALLPRWSDADVSTLLGLERDGDFPGAEREAPGCLVLVGPDTTRLAGSSPSSHVSSLWPADPAVLVAAARAGTWRGQANQLSRGHVEWPIIDEVASAATYTGSEGADPESFKAEPQRFLSPGDAEFQGPPARDVILSRRSAVAFDPRASLPLEALRSMLLRLRPGAVPWDVLDWAPQVHLALFIHRVEGLVPGVYVFLRDGAAEPKLRAAMRSEFLWEPVHDLFLLLPTDVTWVANRLSCDQDIAGEGFFSLAMLSRMEAPIAEKGDWFYRRLFWESGLIGQVLYLEAEARGVRGTGIGCFYDDAVHEALGLSGHAWQSIYHFAVGAPLDDTRLTTEPGYDWDR